MSIRPVSYSDIYFVQLSFDLTESWLANNSDVLGLKRNGRSVFRELALFQDYHGMPNFKNVNPYNTPSFL
jgi:hypothetical protein